MENYSLSDIRSVVGEDGFGGGWMWIIILFLFLFGMGGNGFGGNRANEVQQGLKRVVMPDELRGIVKCPNPKCITNNEPMTTIFHVTDKENGILKCHYCEKEQNKEALKLQ